jgi:hypothetical protein
VGWEGGGRHGVGEVMGLERSMDKWIVKLGQKMTRWIDDIPDLEYFYIFLSNLCLLWETFHAQEQDISQ